jgi:hypothetical protein
VAFFINGQATQPFFTRQQSTDIAAHGGQYRLVSPLRLANKVMQLMINSGLYAFYHALNVMLALVK